ncbi:MAG: alpha/beta hydrolase [Clostridia bacterium]|nr:alpha/beta hydrolase [Clostridia bacterium]
MRKEDMRLSFQGIRVFARIYTPDTPSIQHRALFVSSPASDLTAWNKLAEMLASSGCLVVCADLPGFGKCPASASAPQDNDTRAQILWGILDEVEKSRAEEQTKWHLIGHGNGAAAVMTMALYQPDSTLSRVLLSPVVERFLVSPLHAFLISKGGKGLIEAWHKHYILNKKRFKKLAEKIYGRSVKKERLLSLNRMLSRKNTAQLMYKVLKDGYRLSDAAYEIKTPLMLIWGLEDKIFGGQIPLKLKKQLPEAEKHLVRAAHMAMETHPDMLRDYLRGWFRFSEGREKALIRPTAARGQDKR